MRAALISHLKKKNLLFAADRDYYRKPQAVKHREHRSQGARPQFIPLQHSSGTRYSGGIKRTRKSPGRLHLLEMTGQLYL